MKPLNFDNSPCSPTSSNCVIWGGPNLPCINLCKGDSITDVVEKLALELCNILDTLNINAFDLSCFNLVNSSPQTFTDLINFLIVKVCELDNGTTSPGGTLPGSGCPTDCFVDVASCFVVGNATTMNLTNYVNTIGTRICSLIDTIALQQTAINNLNTRVTVLETNPIPVYTLPTMTMYETLTSTPELLINSVQPINVVIESFVNDIWFAFVDSTGDAGCLASAVSNQTVLPTDFSKVNPTAQMSAQYAGLWVAPSTTVCDTINNIWACIKDLRDAPLQSPFYLYGSTTDAGNDKTTAIQRNNSIYTIGADSYFNNVRVGIGNNGVAYNTALGYGTLSNATTGHSNTAVGYSALTTNAVGRWNTAVGTNSMIDNIDGKGNTAIGWNSLSSNQNADDNTAIGYRSLEANVSGYQNTAIGYISSFSLITGIYNTSVGVASLSGATSGSRNVALGKNSLSNLTIGSNNVAIGEQSGIVTPTLVPNTSSTNCIYIGINTISATASDTNQIVIGANAIGMGSNTTTIGNTSSTDFYLHGNMNLKNTTAVTTASVSQTSYLPVTINGVAYKLLLAV